jgi:hypothetical protein
MSTFLPYSLARPWLKDSPRKCLSFPAHMLPTDGKLIYINLPPLYISETLVEGLVEETPELPQHTGSRLMVSSYISTSLLSALARPWWIDCPGDV